MTRRAARGPSVAKIALTLGMFAGVGAATALKARELPLTWLLTVASVIASSIGVVNWRLGKERLAIDAEDPAAGSELFTLRGFIASCKSVVARARRRVSRRVLVGAGAFGVLLVSVGTPVFGSNTKATAGSVPKLRHSGASARTSTDVPTLSEFEVEPTSDGRLRVSVTIADGHPIEMADLGGMQLLPRGWRARVTVRLETVDLPGLLAVSPFPEPSLAEQARTLPLHFGRDATEHRFATEVCDDREQPLGLRIVPDAGWPKGVYHATFLVEPSLELSSCGAAFEPKLPPPHL